MTLAAQHFLMDTFGSDFDSLPSSLFKDFAGDVNCKDKSLTNSHEEKLVGYSFPPTPPISPGCSPHASETGDLERLHPFCDEFADELTFADDKSLYFQEDDLKEILIKDCMWNGAEFEVAEKEKSVISKPRLNQSRFEKIRLLSQTPPINEYTARVLSVDPAEIFPFPISSETVNNDLDVSDSEEEVEVDVVTIENSKSESVESKQTVVKHTQESSFETAIPSPTPSDSSTFDDFEDEKNDLAGKIRPRRSRKCNAVEIPFYKQARKITKINSSGSGDESENDSEYTRATHNVLERKRRNDLKLKFQRLRDAVPELKDNERAPKVSILRKSWEHINHLKKEETRLATELERQKKLNSQLLKKLLTLNQTGQQ
ncbi:transcriptional regulator Myc-B isoform X2 [Exaiptasia diaphana]|uniref:BHLH domain-containing protein n=1 Tax=Exaiptasia diaphana TaxID=2652724 RepID=A0A913YVA8_EXADI|nr:transcriptional regulator Myc-B isoform X2 [Exaiptasia diaphana]